MKRHYVYKWFRNTVLLGIPVIFATSCKYGMPENEVRISGTVIDKETQQPISNVQISGGSYAADFFYSDSLGKFDGRLHDIANSVNVYFVKEHYKTLDTLLHGNTIMGVFEMEKE